MRKRTLTVFFWPFIVTLLVTVLLGAANSPALAQPREDCLSFDASRLRIERDGREWLLTDGRSRMMVFDTRCEAIRAANIMNHYDMNQQCFVGRPDASLEYFLVGRRAPRGSIAYEDCISFDPRRLELRREGSGWLMTDGRSRMLTFPNAGEARTALAIIKQYGFNRHCFVGRPDASMEYFRR